MTKHSENPEIATCDNNVLANRLLKFNIWDIDTQQYFHDVLSLEKDKIVQWATLEKRTSNNVIWLQFTGLNDKNGIVTLHLTVPIACYAFGCFTELLNN